MSVLPELDSYRSGSGGGLTCHYIGYFQFAACTLGEWPSNKLIRRRNKDTFYWGPGGEHKLFARGTVLAVEGHEDSAKLSIEFGKKISKVIMSKYVKLVKK